MADGDSGRPQMVEPRELVRMVPNPMGELDRSAAPIGALISVEQQRAVAEVQARMIIARANPRNSIRCMDAILQDCARKTLAEQALYQYSRGGSAISGPSIRLAEAIARRWGNIASGIKEISRGEGYSECIAYAWDLETGYYDERQFQVRHWRDTKKGGHPLTDERDIYELIANMGQRRKRAALLTVIPGDVVEAAVNQSEETLKAGADGSPEAIQKMIEAFSAFGVVKAQIEARCQCRAEAIRPAQLVQLRKIYTSLKDEMSSPEDWFDPVKLADAKPADQKPAGGKRTAAPKEQPISGIGKLVRDLHEPSEAKAGPGGAESRKPEAAAADEAQASLDTARSTLASTAEAGGEAQGAAAPEPDANEVTDARQEPAEQAGEAQEQTESAKPAGQVRFEV